MQSENRGKELHDIGLKVVENISDHIYKFPNYPLKYIDKCI